MRLMLRRLICWLLQWRMRRLEREADEALILADREFARELGLLPPALPRTPIGPYTAEIWAANELVREKQRALLTQMFQQGNGIDAQMRAQQQQMQNAHPLQSAQQQMGIGGALGSALGGALGGPAGTHLFGGLLGNTRKGN